MLSIVKKGGEGMGNPTRSGNYNLPIPRDKKIEVF